MILNSKVIIEFNKHSGKIVIKKISIEEITFSKNKSWSKTTTNIKPSKLYIVKIREYTTSLMKLYNRKSRKDISDEELAQTFNKKLTKKISMINFSTLPSKTVFTSENLSQALTFMQKYKNKL